MSPPENPELPWPLPGRHDLRDRLLAAYDDPRRGYHDRRHLADVLAGAERLLAEEPGADRTEVLLAAWFHDAVYAGRGDDEERSARLAERELAVLPPRLVAEVARLVRLTRRHDPAPDDVAGRVLCDADLAILAAAPERYADYLAGVRREYAHLDDAAFDAGRSAVLAELLARRPLFGTSSGRRRWEQAARANLAAELEQRRPL